MKDELRRVEIPGEAEAHARSWAVVQAAFEERRKEGAAGATPRVPLLRRPAVAALATALLIVVALRYVLELTPGEISELLDLPRGTVNSRLRRGLDALAEIVEEEPR